MDNDRIIDMTRALGRAIQMDDRYKRLDAYKRKTEENAALQELIGCFNVTRMNLDRELSKSSSDSGKIADYNSELQRAYDEIMSDADMAEYNRAREEINDLMSYINAILTTAVTGGDPDAVSQPTACTGSCESCGGACH